MAARRGAGRKRATVRIGAAPPVIVGGSLSPSRGSLEAQAATSQRISASAAGKFQWGAPTTATVPVARPGAPPAPGARAGAHAGSARGGAPPGSRGPPPDLLGGFRRSGSAGPRPMSAAATASAAFDGPGTGMPLPSAAPRAAPSSRLVAAARPGLQVQARKPGLALASPGVPYFGSKPPRAAVDERAGKSTATPHGDGARDGERGRSSARDSQEVRETRYFGSRGNSRGSRDSRDGHSSGNGREYGRDGARVSRDRDGRDGSRDRYNGYAEDRNPPRNESGRRGDDRDRGTREWDRDDRGQGRSGAPAGAPAPTRRFEGRGRGDNGPAGGAARNGDLRDGSERRAPRSTAPDSASSWRRDPDSDAPVQHAAFSNAAPAGARGGSGGATDNAGWFGGRGQRPEGGRGGAPQQRRGGWEPPRGRGAGRGAEDAERNTRDNGREPSADDRNSRFARAAGSRDDRRGDDRRRDGPPSRDSGARWDRDRDSREGGDQGRRDNQRFGGAWSRRDAPPATLQERRPAGPATGTNAPRGAQPNRAGQPSGGWGTGGKGFGPRRSGPQRNGYGDESRAAAAGGDRRDDRRRDDRGRDDRRDDRGRDRDRASYSRDSRDRRGGDDDSYRRGGSRADSARSSSRGHRDTDARRDGRPDAGAAASSRDRPGAAHAAPTTPVASGPPGLAGSPATPGTSFGSPDTAQAGLARAIAHAALDASPVLPRSVSAADRPPVDAYGTVSRSQSMGAVGVASDVWGAPGRPSGAGGLPPAGSSGAFGQASLLAGWSSGVAPAHAGRHASPQQRGGRPRHQSDDDVDGHFGARRASATLGVTGVEDSVMEPHRGTVVNVEGRRGWLQWRNKAGQVTEVEYNVQEVEGGVAAKVGDVVEFTFEQLPFTRSSQLRAVGVTVMPAYTNLSSSPPKYVHHGRGAER